MQYVTDKDIIDRAKMTLNLTQTEEYDDEIGIYVAEGFRQIMNLEVWTKQAKKIPVKNGKAKLPCNFYEFIGAGNGLTSTIYYNERRVDVDGSLNAVPVGNLSRGVRRLNGFMVFSSNVTDTTIDLTFRGLNTDDNGNALIDELLIPACQYYASAMFCEVVGRPDYNPFFKQYASRFDTEHGKANGKFAARQTREERYQIAALSNSNLQFYEY